MQYFFRSLKYFLALCVLCTGLMALMILTGTSSLSFGQTLWAMFHTDRFLLLLAALVVLALFYPRFGFVRRTVAGDIVRHRRQILSAFEASGFRLAGEDASTMRFRAAGRGLWLLLLGEDEITVAQQGDRIAIEGIRRGVARVQYRLESYLQMLEHDEK